MNPEILKINPTQPEASLVTYAAEQIKKGNVICVPTDTFYGLAVDPYNLRSVDKVYEIKDRARHKPLSLLIESIEQAELLAAPLPDEFYLLAEKFWPGPLTIIVKASPRLPLRVTAHTGNVAMRIPAAEIPLAIVRTAGVPITATSANLSGAAESTTAQAVKEQLSDRVPIIVDGGTTPHNQPTTIVNLAEDGGWKLLRDGAVPVQAIEDVLGDQ